MPLLKIISIFALASLSQYLLAQDIREPNKLPILMNKRIDCAKAFPSQGYRIHIMSKSGNYSKQGVLDAQLELNNVFPYVNTYISYDEPYFKLKLGNFRSRMEALAYLEEVKITYPQAYIVSDYLDLESLLNLKIISDVPEKITEEETETETFDF